MASLTKNFIYNLLYNVSRVIFPLITAPYVARVLEPEGVGIYNFAMTYAGYFALVALLGVPTYGVREVARVREDKHKLNALVSQLMSIVTLSTLVVTIIYILTLTFINQLNKDFIYFVLAGFSLYLSPFQTNWFYQGIEEFDFITIRSIIVKVISIVCLFVFVRTRDDLIPYIIISVMGTVVADIWNYVKMSSKGIKPRFTLKGLSPHVKPLFVLFASSVAISIYTVLDTLMLGFMREYNEVGYYSNAMNASKILLVVVTSLSVVSIPRFSSYIGKGLNEQANKLANRSFAFVGLLAFPLSIGLGCVSPVFVPWFFGDQFMGSIVPLEILSLLNIAIGFSNILGVQILVGLGKDKLFLHCVLCGTISNFLLNCILIPLWGATGASIASVIAEFTVTVMMFYYMYKETPVRVNVKSDVIKSFAGAMLFIPLKFIMPKCDERLIYLVEFAVIAAILYMLSQFILRNSSLQEFIDQMKLTLKAKTTSSKGF